MSGLQILFGLIGAKLSGDMAMATEHRCGMIGGKEVFILLILLPSLGVFFLTVKRVINYCRGLLFLTEKLSRFTTPKFRSV